MNNQQVVRVEWAELEGQRPRKAGANARLGEHGVTVKVPLARLTLADGSSGFGFCRAGLEPAQQLLGSDFSHLFSPEEGTLSEARAFDFPVWDLAGQLSSQPVYALAAKLVGLTLEGSFRVPCYDTSLYFDDLHLASTEAAAELIAGEAREGYGRGHRAFKIKVGRGARHLPLEEGTRRDIAVIQAVRAAVGPECRLMIDANNGYNLNLAKRVLLETADCHIFWIEEAFHEDHILYRELQAWLKANGLSTLIADGEGDASPNLLDWAEAGIVNVIQYDIFSYGFTNWLMTGQQLDRWGALTAPHHYGRHYGNYVSGHLAGAIQGFGLVEWDETVTPGLDGSAYTVQEGGIAIPSLPGFGLKLDEAVFQEAVEKNGFRCSL